MQSNLNSFKLITTIATFALVVICFAVFISGCSQKNIPTTETASKKIKLTLWTLQMQTFASEMNRLEKAFEAKHPNIDVVWVDVPFSEGEKKVLTSILSGHPPDVVNLNPDFSALLASRNALLDLNDWLSPEQKASYVPVTLQACQIKSDANHTLQFGLPWYITTAITFYNKQLLQKAGFQHPPQNLKQLKQLALKLKQKHSGTALLLPLSQGGRFLKWLYQAGISLKNENGNYLLDSPEAIAELTYWNTMIKEGLAPKAMISQSFQDVLDQYQSGSVAMMVAGSSVLGMIKENAPTIYQQTQLAPQFPQANQGKVDFATMLLAVPKATPHPKEAVELATFITQNGYELSQLAPVLPSTTKQLKRPYFSRLLKGDLLSKARVISAQQLLKAKAAFQIHPKQKQLNATIDYAVQSAFLGKLTEAKALKIANEQANQF